MRGLHRACAGTARTRGLGSASPGTGRVRTAGGSLGSGGGVENAGACCGGGRAGAGGGGRRGGTGRGLPRRGGLLARRRRALVGRRRRSRRTRRPARAPGTAWPCATSSPSVPPCRARGGPGAHRSGERLVARPGAGCQRDRPSASTGGRGPGRAGPEQVGADPHHGGPLLDGHLEVGAHADRALGEAERGRRGRRARRNPGRAPSGSPAGPTPMRPSHVEADGSRPGPRASGTSSSGAAALLGLARRG